MNLAIDTQDRFALSAKEREMAARLAAALVDATGFALVGVSTRAVSAEDKRRLPVVTLQANQSKVDIVVRTVRHAYPRDVREAIWQLESSEAPDAAKRNQIPMVAADSLSPGAKALLRERGIGYFEPDGCLYLRWRHCLVNIERAKRVPAKARSIPLFSGARENVVHALLMSRGAWITGAELAEHAQTSSYTCSVVLQELEKREWCQASGAGRTLRRRLVEPGLLLDAWAEQWVLRKNPASHWYTFAQRPDQLMRQLADRLRQSEISTPWAFSGAAAANLYAPLLTHVDTADIVIAPGESEAFAHALALEPADQGSNVTLMERDGASMLFRHDFMQDQSHLSSPFILYLDLQNGHGRNKELAQRVREKLEL